MAEARFQIALCASGMTAGGVEENYSTVVPAVEPESQRTILWFGSWHSKSEIPGSPIRRPGMTEWKISCTLKWWN